MKPIQKLSLLPAMMMITGMITMQSCTPPSTQPAAEMTHGPEITKAVCVLYPTETDSVSGIVTFTKTDSGIMIQAEVKGLTPGKHGFHIHQWGDCSDPQGKSAGGHYNPEGTEHGAPHGNMRHVGDLGNITADDTGHATLTLLDTELTLNGPHTIIGRGMIVHAGEDDLVSQPTGNAGARVACGVIGVAE